MAGEMAGWCGPDRYVDSQGRVHVAVVDGKAIYVCKICSLLLLPDACKDSGCMAGRDVHFELAAAVAKVVCDCRAVPVAVCEVQEAVRGPKGTEGGGE